jgi:hypothetical protein
MAIINIVHQPPALKQQRKYKKKTNLKYLWLFRPKPELQFPPCPNLFRQIYSLVNFHVHLYILLDAKYIIKLKRSQFSLIINFSGHNSGTILFPSHVSCMFLPFKPHYFNRL